MGGNALILDLKPFVAARYFGLAARGRVSPIHAAAVTLESLGRFACAVDWAYVCIALEGGHPQWREAIWPGYKSARITSREVLGPVMAQTVTLLKGAGVLTCGAHGFEADDVVKTACNIGKDAGLTCLVLTNDKDLWPLLDLHGGPQVFRSCPICKGAFVLDCPCWGSGMQMVQPVYEGKAFTNRQVAVYDFGKRRFVSEYLCRARFGIGLRQLYDYLTLVGDSADCVPGVKGWGRVRASRALRQYANLDGIREAIRSRQISGATAAAFTDAWQAVMQRRRIIEPVTVAGLSFETMFDASGRDKLRALAL